MRAFAPEQKAVLPAGPFAVRSQARGAIAHDRAVASSGFAYDFSRIPLRAKSHSAPAPELGVAPPGDAYEREAVRAADAVMADGPPVAARSSFPSALRRCACGGTCSACRAERRAVQDEETLHRREARAGGTPSVAPPAVHRVLASPGRPLEAPTRVIMEERFGADFSAVRVHTGAAAATSARAVDALAYTVGTDVVFAAGRYAPGTPPGDRLIAHELAHTLQQGSGAAPLRLQRVPAAARAPGLAPVFPPPSTRAPAPPAAASPPPVPARGTNPAACVAPGCDRLAAAPAPGTADEARRLGADWLAAALACVRTDAAGSNASHAADIVANEEAELTAEVSRLDAALPRGRASYARELAALCRRKQREIEVEFRYNVVFESPVAGIPWVADAAGWAPLEAALAALPAQATWSSPLLIRFRREACHPDDLGASGACTGQSVGPLTRSFVGGEADVARGEVKVFNAGAGSTPYSRSAGLGLPAIAQTLRHEVGHIVMSQLTQAERNELFETVMGWNTYPWDWITVNPAPYPTWAATRTALRTALRMDDTQLDAWLNGLVLDRSEQHGAYTFSKRAHAGGKSFYVQSYRTAEMPAGTEFEYARTSQAEYLAELYALAVSRPEFLHASISASQAAWLRRVVFHTPADHGALAREAALADPPRMEFVVRGSRLFTWEQLDALLRELTAARPSGSRAA